MRARALAPLAVLAVLALLSPTWLVLPASAQESPAPSATPSPARTVCPNIAFATTREDQEAAPAGTPRTYTFSSDVQPAKVPDGWTLTRLAPAPVEVVDSRPPGEAATFTVSVTETTMFRVDTVGPDGCTSEGATFTRRVTPASSPTPPAIDRPCPSFTVRADHSRTAGSTAVLRVTADSPREDVVYRLRLSRGRPTPQVVVRDVVVTGTVTTEWALRLGESHRFFVEAFPTSRGDFCIPAWSTVVDVPVRPTLTLGAVRNGPRDYTFTGRVLPGRGQALVLYRVGADGSRVLTARTTVRPDGTYRFDRRFTGSGHFGFLTTVGGSSTHTAGASSVRATVVH